MTLPRTLTSTVVHDGRSRVRIDRVDLGPHAVDREVVERDDAVAVVAVDDDGCVVLVNQYRHPVGELLVEIPAGTLDVPGESPREAAVRELAEETGLEAERLEPLGQLLNSAGWTDERTYLFLSTGLRVTGRPEGFEPDDEEAGMTVLRRPLTDVLQEVIDGRLSDAKSVVGVLRAAARLASQPGLA